MGTLSAGALIKLTATQEISPDRWVHLEQGEVRGRFTPEGFVLSFLTKLAQAELRAGVTIKAVIGPDTDGGFSISSLRRPGRQRER
jgi:hypothetical protein